MHVSPTRLAVITTHPVQYYAPLFRQLALSNALEIKVFYTWPQSQEGKYDPGFGKSIAWDIPLLDGYEHTFVANTASRPGSSHFNGIVNPTLVREIEAWKADAVLVFGWSYRSHLQAMRHFKGRIPVYFRGDSHLLDERPGPKTLLRRVFLRWVYSHVDAAFVVGRNNGRYFAAHGLRDAQLIPAPHCIDNERFAADADAHQHQADAWRTQLGIAPGDTVFLFAGKLEPKKNPVSLLDAFLAWRKPHTHLVFVGNGVLEAPLKEAARQQAHVHFMDFQNQGLMPAVYRLGDVFVLPSQGPGETWGLALNEAMACGRPVLASDKVGGAIDLVRPGANGYVFQSGSTHGLLEALEMLFHADRAALGRASLATISEFSLQACSRAIVRHVAAGPQP